MGDLTSKYPLTGLREATTAPQLRLIEGAVHVLGKDERVLAAWLVGSFALGEADPFSDVDLHCSITDESVAELKQAWPDLVHEITPTVMATPFFPDSLGGYCVTPDWVHIDLALHPRSSLDPHTVEGMKPLFDKTGELLPDTVTPRPSARQKPYFPTAVVDWFFYMFGNLVVLVGRNEPAWAMNGVITLRDTGLVPLMFAERGVTKMGGNKRLNPFLSAAQRQVLLNLPPIAPTIDSVIEAEVAIARDFIPRGRRLATATGALWPQAFEDATVDRIERSIGITVLERG